MNSDPRVLLKNSIGNIEYLMLQIKRLDLVITVVYRPPTANFHSFKQVIEEIREKLHELPSPAPSLILTGDFNFPTVRWPQGEIGACLVDTRLQFEKLKQLAGKNLRN